MSTLLYANRFASSVSTDVEGVGSVQFVTRLPPDEGYISIDSKVESAAVLSIAGALPAERSCAGGCSVVEVVEFRSCGGKPTTIHYSIGGRAIGGSEYVNDVHTEAVVTEVASCD